MADDTEKRLEEKAIDADEAVASGIFASKSLGEMTKDERREVLYGGKVGRYSYNSEKNEILEYGKVIGHGYDAFCVLTDKNGLVISFGFEEKSSEGTKPIKINRRELITGKNQLFDLGLTHQENIDIANSLVVGYPVQELLYKRGLEALKQSSIFSEVECHLNELVIDTSDYQIKRLIGLAFDSHDCYYIHKDIDGKISYMTCVGGFVILKDKIDLGYYENIEFRFMNNKCFAEKELKFKMFDDSGYYMMDKNNYPKGITRFYLLLHAKCYGLFQKTFSNHQD